MNFLYRTGLALIAFALALHADRMAHADFVRLMIDSEPGDFVGGGQQRTLEYDNDFGSRLQTFDSLGSVRWVLDDAVGTAANSVATVHFRTDTVGVPLQPGTFVNARRAGFANPGEPGMDVAYQHRGSNTLFGEFTINEVEFFQFNGSSTLGKIDVSFEQHSELPTNPALFGNIFYQHSDFVSAIPEPAVVPIVAAFLCAGVWVQRRRKSKRQAAAVQS